jgi:hypothetical protein
VVDPQRLVLPAVGSVVRVLVVVPPGSGLSTDPATYRALEQPGVTLAGVVPTEGQARQQLLDAKVDVVVVPPPDVKQRFQAGQQSAITVEYDTVDPINPSCIKMIQDAGFQFMDCRQMAGIERRHFRDSWHLNEQGIELFTRAFTQRFLQQCPDLIALKPPRGAAPPAEQASAQLAAKPRSATP